MNQKHIRQEHIRLALSLPPRLLHFFTKYPPGSFPSAAQPVLSSVAENTSSQDANAMTVTETKTLSHSQDAKSTKSLRAFIPSNPFLPYKHPISGHWHAPAYSLRHQADIIKLAERHNVLSLLPWSPKLPSEVERKRIEHGLRVKGTGLGQKVKGKLWERTLKGRLAERTRAMEGMDEMINQWKQRGHGRGWKKWPK